MNDRADYIVVGGGASGCAVTSALLKNNYDVSLFEAGYSHHNFLLDVPAGFFKFVRTNYHPSGSAKMGADSDKMAVLDSKMRVRGIENLRVCDLSVLPNINSGNTAAPAMILGLRCGDLISNP